MADDDLIEAEGSIAFGNTSMFGDADEAPEADGFGVVISDATNARAMNIQSGSTLTVSSAFNVNGTIGKLMTIQPSSGSAGLAFPMAGIVQCDYLSINNITLSNGAFYAGLNSTDGGSNVGIVFGVRQPNNMRVMV